MSASPKVVKGPDNVPISALDLPTSSEKRWTPRKKAIVLCAIKGGLLSSQVACARYSMTDDELLIWKTNYAQHGLDGLKSSRTQLYRK